jgi:hypothetical protein
MNQEQKLERWAIQELKLTIDQTIFDDNKGGWIAFGRYHIIPADAVFDVWRNDSFIASFGSKRSSLSWCIADNKNQTHLAQQIKTLDQKKQLIENDIVCRSGMRKRSKSPETREIIKTKLEPKIALNSVITAELEKCISSAKYIQLRGFSNETARTSHT